MEASTRKRKLNEIDKNVPFFSTSVLLCEATEDKIKPKSLKPQNLIASSAGCENVQSSTDVGEFENPNFQTSNGRKDDRPVKIEGRNPMKSCDRRYRKKLVLDDPKKLDLSLCTIQPKPLAVPDLSQCNITFKPDHENDKSNQNGVKEADLREMRMWFACDYFEDILAYEFCKEKRYKLSKDFCRKYDINPARREVLIHWLISVQVHLKAGNNTLHLAVNLLDILLDKIDIPCKLLQVSALAAFWVAYKFIHGNLSVKTLIGLCGGAATRDMILGSEILVLESSRALQAGGDMSTFFNYILFKLFGNSFPAEIYYCGQYFIEIMLIQFVFIDCSAHEKAITAVYAALVIFNSSLQFKLFEFSRFITAEKLRMMYCQLSKFLKMMYSDEDILRNSCLFRKYKSSRYFKISTHEKLKELDLS